jgi:lipoprotein-anchoring transpeptidase ErfK/SrfK
MSTSLLSRIATAAAGLSLMACGPVNIINKGPGGGPTAHKAEHVLYQWYDDGGPGELKVRIDLNQQIATYTRGGRPIGWSYVATGKEGHSTPPGNYRISEKLVDKHSGSYGWIEDEWGNVTNGDATPGTRVPEGERYVPAPMPYWMRITGGGIGMHAGVIPKPGETASHGCIRLPKEFAPVLFENVRVGTPVTISH